MKIFHPMAGTIAVVAIAGAILAPATRAAAQANPQSSPQIIEQVLVKVNGDIITKSELEERQIGALRQRNLNPDVLKNDEQLKKALEAGPLPADEKRAAK